MQYNEAQVISKAHPVFQPKLRMILNGLRNSGWQPKIAELIRTEEQQRKKVEQGYSQTMKSWHVPSTKAFLSTGKSQLWEVHGAAADIVDARYGWSGPAANTHFQFWTDLGRLAKMQGCEWGGDWKTFKDVAHIELKFIESGLVQSFYV